MEKNRIEKRMCPRTEVTYPVEIAPEGILGESVNVSETGLQFTVSKPMRLTNSRITINFSVWEFVKAPFQIVWKQNFTNENKYAYGVCFLDVGDKEMGQLRQVVIKNEIDRTVEGIPDKNIKKTISNFFTKDLAVFVAMLNDLQRNPTSWISQEQNKLDTYSHTLVAKGDQLIERIEDRRIIKKIKRKFRELVGVFPYESTLISQGLDKPYGYPGDFEVIEKIYNNRPLSEDNAKYFDLIFLNNPYARAVRSRKEKMKEILKEFINQENLSTINILNLGCGPCREIRELFIAGGFKTNKKIHFTLLDQDEKALTYAKNLLKDADKNIQCNFIKEDVFSFLKTPASKGLTQKQQLVYTIGLADYLPDRVLKKIIQGGFGLLSKGGTFILAHKDKGKDPHAPVFPDWFCDWHFVTRNEDYLIKLIHEISLEGFSITHGVENTGKIIFVYLTKDD